MRRASWNKDQINASIYASVPPPPVVDVNTYVAPSGGGTLPRRNHFPVILSCNHTPP